jgi:hypothetical protein
VVRRVCATLTAGLDHGRGVVLVFDLFCFELLRLTIEVSFVIELGARSRRGAARADSLRAPMPPLTGASERISPRGCSASQARCWPAFAP